MLFRSPDEYWNDFLAGMQMRRDLFCSGLTELGIPVVIPQGTYFATSDVRPLGYSDGWAFCQDLPHRAGVVAIPQEVFHLDAEAGKPYVRWAFCKKPEVLNEALDRLASAFS